MDLIKIKLSELNDFVNSDFYRRLNVKPITKNRAVSYIHNPNGKPSDIVLYYILENNKLIAFRTVLADTIHNERFCWLSGNWVAEDHRGKGLTKKIFNEISKDWDGRLMFTNYSPDGLRANRKHFKSICTFKGVRAYFSFSLKERFASGILSSFFLSIADIVIALAFRLRKLFFVKKMPSSYDFTICRELDEACLDLVRANKDKFAFGRDENELKWIFSFPWVSTQKEDFIPEYPFSSYSKEFYYQIVKLSDKGKAKGFFIFSVRNGHLKTLYFVKDHSMDKEIALWLKNYTTEHNLKSMTVFEKEIAEELKKNHFPALFAKDYGTNIFSTFKFHGNDDLFIQDGDGDSIFT